MPMPSATAQPTTQPRTRRSVVSVADVRTAAVLVMALPPRLQSTEPVRRAAEEEAAPGWDVGHGVRRAARRGRGDSGGSPRDP